MLTLSDRFSTALAERDKENRLRRLKSSSPLSAVEILLDGHRMLNFSSNDYLGLAQHPELKVRAALFAQQYGAGATASRLICGNLDIYETIESKLAALKGTEAALILPTGYQANASVLPALTDKNSFIVLDKYSHNSLLQGAQLSACDWKRYQHNDHLHLTQRLQAAASKSYSQRWIATESVFSMDGDRCDLDALSAIAAQNSACLYLDEAHATGVLGHQGMGLSVGKNIHLVMGTFGKALGSFGAYIACSKVMRDYLLNYCGGFIYSTGLPPPVLGAIDAALDLVATMDGERAHLHRLADKLRAELQKLGLDTGGSTTQIVPIIVGEDDQAVQLSRHLEDKGIFAPAIRPPTVPAGTARVRVSLSAAHTDEHLEHLLEAIRAWHA